jgi:glycoside/pentoside/hexuronide:cation symporter, GPH family
MREAETGQRLETGRLSKERLGWGRLIAYGGLQFPLATIGLPLSIYLAPFYAGELGLPLAALGTAMLLARLSDIITDPLIGMASDRWRPAIGRRRVWVPMGAIVLGLGVFLLFNPAKGVGLGYFLMALAMTYVGYTMTRLPYHAWGGELSNSYEERTRITSTRQVFSLGGLIFATLVPALILQRPGATSADVLRGLSIAMLVALPLFAALLFFVVREPTAPPADPKIDLRRTLRQLWRNGPFRRIAIVLLLGFIAETFRITITLFFARDIIGVKNIGIIYVYYFATGLLAVPIWNWIGNRLGKHRALALAFGVVIVTNIGIFCLSFGQELAFTLLFIGKGFCFGALELMPAAMVADTADVDTVMSRERRQGLLFAIIGMIINFGQAVGQWLSLNLLGLVGYQAAGGNDADALSWLHIFYCLAPLVFLLPAMALLWHYPLTAARHRRFQAYVERL